MKLVAVKWIDAHTEQGWVPKTGDYAPGPCWAVGFIVKETEEFICLTQCTASDHEDVCNILSIPAGMVEEIVDLPELPGFS